jgi:hypothetical protein
VRVDQLDEPNERLRAGMSGYLLPFVIVSMHLLVVLIGAGYMARTKRLGAGRVLERPAPAAAPNTRRRSFAVAGGLVSGMVVNLLLAALCCYLIAQRPLPTSGGSAPASAAWKSVATAINAAPDWVLPLLGLLFLVNVILLVVVWYWQKWGVVGLVIVPVVQAIALANAGFSQPIAIGFLLLALAPAVLLTVLLVSGPRPTAWSQMD